MLLVKRVHHHPIISDFHEIVERMRFCAGKRIIFPHRRGRHLSPSLPLHRFPIPIFSLLHQQISHEPHTSIVVVVIVCVVPRPRLYESNNSRVTNSKLKSGHELNVGL